MVSTRCRSTSSDEVVAEPQRAAEAGGEVALDPGGVEAPDEPTERLAEPIGHDVARAIVAESVEGRSDQRVLHELSLEQGVAEEPGEAVVSRWRVVGHDGT